MPIILNNDRGKQIVQQAEFGTGDILILTVRLPEESHYTEVWLVQHEEKPLEEWQAVKDPAYPDGVETDEMPQVATIALRFNRRESIEALQRSLDILLAGWPVDEQSNKPVDAEQP